MNWSEEKYAKLYIRDTVTWLSWPWQARAVFPLLLRKVDGAGIVAHGRVAPAVGIGLLIGIPVEVVEPALEALLADGTAELTPAGVLLPKFLEAQEARKSDRLRSLESRERRRNDAKEGAAASHGDTKRHNPSPPSPAQPSPAQPEKIAGKKPPAPPKPPKPVEPPDPRHAPLVKALCEATPGYAFGGGRDAKAVTGLLALADATVESEAAHAEVVRRWLRAWGRTGYPTVRTLSELVTHWNHFATAGPAVASAPLEQHTHTGRLEL